MKKLSRATIVGLLSGLLLVGCGTANQTDSEAETSGNELHEEVVDNKQNEKVDEEEDTVIRLLEKNLSYNIEGCTMKRQRS